jgi:hypothetical protein
VDPGGWFYSVATADDTGVFTPAQLAEELHEMQENFKYRGRSIYGPHIDPDALWEASAILDSRA